MRKQDAPAPVMVDGPPLTSTAQALAFMDTVRARSAGSVFRAAFDFNAGAARRATLHAEEKSPRPFSLDDSLLGIPLADHVRRACGTAKTCTLLLDVERGPRMPGGDADFTVVAVSSFTGDSGAPRIQVRRPVACLRIMPMPVLHCARGPARCPRCADAASQPPSPALLDVCPDGDLARPTVELEHDGKKVFRVYDVLRRFASEDDARAFAAAHDVEFIGATRRGGER